MNQSNTKRRGLSSSTIKIIAMLAMTLDHAAWVLFDPIIRYNYYPAYPNIADSYSIMRFKEYYFPSYGFHMFGRIAFPIFLFLLVEGVHHTRNIWKYLLTMLTFALLSEVPFDLLLSDEHYNFAAQNTLFTLTLCILAVYAMQRLKDKWYFSLPIVGACALAAYFLNVDYGYLGVLAACIMQLFYRKRVLGYVLGCAFLSIFKPWELCAFLAVPLIWLYNGQRGFKLKYSFYLYYPLHLIVLYIISSRIF